MNDLQLQDSFLLNNNSLMWQCWRSKFDHLKNPCTQVDGCVDSYTIASKVRDHLAKDLLV